MGLPLFGGLYGPEAIINGELLRGILGGGRPPEFFKKKEEDCLNGTGRVKQERCNASTVELGDKEHFGHPKIVT